MNTLSLQTLALSLYEQLTTEKNNQNCKVSSQLRRLTPLMNLHNFPTSFSQVHNTLQIRFVQVG